MDTCRNIVNNIKQRLLNWLISIDQFFFCTITLGGSMPDETMSAAAYRGEQLGYISGKIARPIIDALFFFDPNHCYESYISEIQHKQQAPELNT